MESSFIETREHDGSKQNNTLDVTKKRESIQLCLINSIS